MLVQSVVQEIFHQAKTILEVNFFVVRGYRSGSTGASGSLGDSVGISQSLDPGQVIVSTGKIGTGFIRLNVIQMIQLHLIWTSLKEQVVVFMMFL